MAGKGVPPHWQSYVSVKSADESAERAAALGGAVLTETVFNLAGVGRALFDAITGRDYAVVQGFTVVIALGYVLVNLAVDISYGYLDPRIRVK